MLNLIILYGRKKIGWSRVERGVLVNLNIIVKNRILSLGFYNFILIKLNFGICSLMRGSLIGRGSWMGVVW